MQYSGEGYFGILGYWQNSCNILAATVSFDVLCTGLLGHYLKVSNYVSVTVAHTTAPGTLGN